MKKIIKLFLFLVLMVVSVNYVKATDIIDGVYQIQSALNSDKVLDVSDAKTSNSTNIQLYTSKYNTAQKWNVKRLDNGYYTISTMLDENKVLDVAWGGKSNGTNVQLYSSNKSNAQQWMIKEAGNGYYYIISKCNKLYMDVAGGKTADKTNIQMYKGNKSNAQKFKFVEVIEGNQTIEDGNYNIVSAKDETKGLDVGGENLSSSSNIQLYSINNSWNQVWNVKYLNNGYYKISLYFKNNLALDVAWGGKSNGTNVQLYSSNNSNAQQWIIKETSDGNYNIISKLDNMYLDVKESSMKNGTNIQIYQKNNKLTQKFKFIKSDAVKLEDGLYTINNKLDLNKYVGVVGDYADSKNNIELFDNSNSNSQKWYIKHISNGYYSIRSAVNSNQVLDVAWAGTTSGTNVQSYTWNGSNAQLWYIKYTNGGYTLMPKNSNLLLNVSDEKSEVGSNIQVYNSNGSDSQIFQFKSTTANENEKSYKDGYYMISSALNNNMVLDVANGNRVNGTNIQLYRSNSTLAQIWYLKYLDDGYYSITSALNRNTSLDVAGAGTTNGTNVQLYKFNNSLSQQWIVKDVGDGYVSIISKINNLALDIKYANTSNGTNVQMYTNNGTPAQKFKLIQYNGKKLYKGIDVSKWQGNIDWAKVSQSQIDFAIIRVGYGDDEYNQDDTKFKSNVAECEKYNIPYGIYLYSYATNVIRKDGATDNAYSEVNHVMRLVNEIEKKDYSPNLGTKVFLDMEDASTKGVGKEGLTDIADTFCSTIEEKGYSCGIYANKTWLTNYLNTKSLVKNYEIWLAEWPKDNSITSFNTAKSMKPSYNLTNYKYWQFTSKGKIPGISNLVDLNLGYDIFD